MKNKPSPRLFKWNHDCLSSLQAELSINKKNSQSGLQFQKNTRNDQVYEGFDSNRTDYNFLGFETLEAKTDHPSEALIKTMMIHQKIMLLELQHADLNRNDFYKNKNPSL